MVPSVRATAVLDVTYGRYNIEDDGPPMPGDDDSDRVIQPGVTPEGGAVVNTGTFYGPVEVTVEVLDSEPEAASGSGWDQVEDTTLTAVGDKIGVFPPDEEPPDLPELSIATGSRYHVRVSVRGLRAGRAREQYDTGEAACEFHFVQLWPEA
jgi:hypothetical protein